MGKNPGNKMRPAGVGGGEEGGSDRVRDVDVSYHTSEWHQARLAGNLFFKSKSTPTT